VPAREATGGEGVVLEEEVLDRMLLAAVTAQEVGSGAILDGCPMRLHERLPLVAVEDGGGHPPTVGEQP
jgi:hypothetical protein